MRRLAILTSTAALVIGASCASSAPSRSPEAVAAAALKAAPVFDGHNDVPDKLRDLRRNVLGDFDFRDTTGPAGQAPGVPPMQTDLVRLRKGQVGAQFWSVYVSASHSEPQAIQATLEQIDVMKRLIARHPADLQFCVDTACIQAAAKAGRIASLLGMEGGHSIGGSLAVLRQMHSLGVRYMTLTHSKNNAWADSATDKPQHGGLTAFGRDVVREMQRLGMLVDLSHVSEATMLATLDIAKAPVIFSHSNTRTVAGHPRNVPDSVLLRLKGNGGIVMINAYPPFVSQTTWEWNSKRAAEKARLDVLFNGNPAGADAGLQQWEAANPFPTGGLGDIANHLNHIKRLIGAEHVGLGGDFDGIDKTVAGMEDVSTYPALFVELARRGWSQAELEQLSSRNLLRVMRAAEAFAASQRSVAPFENPTSF